MKTLLALALVALAPHAFAQAFPSHPVTIVVPFPPGGGTDALTRILQPTLSKLWAQPIIVENKPGAAGAIGGDSVAAAKPDGHTLLMSSTAGITAKNVDTRVHITVTAFDYDGNAKQQLVDVIYRSVDIPHVPKAAWIMSWDVRGTEPFWSVKIRKDALTLERPEPPAISVPNAGPAMEGDTAVWRGDQLKIVKVNIDEEQQLAMRYGVQSIPNMILFENGEPKASAIGAQPKGMLERALGLAS